MKFVLGGIICAGHSHYAGVQSSHEFSGRVDDHRFRFSLCHGIFPTDGRDWIFLKPDFRDDCCNPVVDLPGVS